MRQMIPKRGEAAPDFTLTSHEGKEVSMKGQLGHKVLLWFFPEANTPGCTAEGRGFRDHQDYFDENDIVVLGVSFDSVEDNAEFAKKNGFTFALLCDTTHRVALAYGACEDLKARNADRISFLIDEAGKISRIYDRVDPRDHPARVLADILGV
jgi:thioredoxin-dependent peroxiredoxin